MQSLLGKHWHHLPIEEVIELLETDPESGLDIFEVKHRQEHFGPNTLTPQRGKGPLMRFLLQFHNPLIYSAGGDGHHRGH
jgi:cation-transporting ATPase F